MVNLALGCVRHYMCLLRFSEEGEDDLDLFWGENFAWAGVAGGLEGGEEGFVGMDFVGEALPSVTLLCLGIVQASLTLRSTSVTFACTLLTFGDVA